MEEYFIKVTEINPSYKIQLTLYLFTCSSTISRSKSKIGPLQIKSLWKRQCREGESFLLKDNTKCLVLKLPQATIL